MRRFESVVMAETEPVQQGTLWLRPRKNTIDPKGPTQLDIWYFSERGWRPIADFDTRYDFDAEYSTDTSESPVTIVPETNPEVGIVKNKLNFSIYDGSRDMQSSGNLVLESGLKKEINALRLQLETEVERLDGRINNLSSTLANLVNTVARNTDRIAMVEGRLALLET